jgi:organic radical activating enzyme
MMALPFRIIEQLPGPAPPPYRIAEVYMFDTCTHKCGYCWLAESGQVLDFKQLEPFRDRSVIDKITSFFLSRTTPETKWLIQLTGGEPLIAPSLNQLLDPVIEAGNRIAFYTALLVGERHPGFRFLIENPYPRVDYVMASFHPEAEMNEAKYFEKIRILKDVGHKVFLRFVGHPQRLHRLEELSDRCREMDICFYPTTLMSNNYPGAYTRKQKDLLRSHFSSLSQNIQLEGAVNTTGLQCYGGSRVIAIHLQTGNITPCISVHQPSLGNIYEDRLELNSAPIQCPEPGAVCSCDVHFQQNVVISCDDRTNFEKQMNGFVPPQDFQQRLAAVRANGLLLGGTSNMGIGGIVDDSRLFYTIDEVRENFRKAHGLPRTGLNGAHVRELVGVVQDLRSANEYSQIEQGSFHRIVTPTGRWAYAAFLPLKIPADTAGQLWVRIRATVQQGEAGFGVLNRGGTAFQDRAFAAAREEDYKIFLKISQAADAESVVIENSTPGGEPAEILLREVTVLSESP